MFVKNLSVLDNISFLANDSCYPNPVYPS